jgi:hypothetical protein
MKKKTQKRQTRRASKNKKKTLPVSGKVFSICLLIFVVGAIAMFVYFHKASSEVQRTHMAPRFPATQKALALANGADGVILRS